MTHIRQAHSHEQVRLHNDQTLQLQSLDELESFYACTMILTPTILVDQLHQQCDDEHQYDIHQCHDQIRDHEFVTA